MEDGGARQGWPRCPPRFHQIHTVRYHGDFLSSACRGIRGISAAAIQILACTRILWLASGGRVWKSRRTAVAVKPLGLLCTSGEARTEACLARPHVSSDQSTGCLRRRRKGAERSGAFRLLFSAAQVVAEHDSMAGRGARGEGL